ncbi:MAG TPA: cache domain-containing protein [Opitutaceae bacterium]|jgi:sigma-B regulation protein RsbU (phosphoserine phosphatase)
MRAPFLQRLPVRLAGTILLLGFVTVPLVSELGRRAVERIVLDQAELQAATATIAVADRLQDVLRSVETSVRFVARDLENRPVTAADAGQVIHAAMAGDPNLSDFSLAFEPGALGAQTGHFGLNLRRSGSHFAETDLAAGDYKYWTRDWYTDAAARGDIEWSEPFADPAAGDEAIVRVSMPFYREVNGRRAVAGVVSAGISVDAAARLADENEFFESGYVIIFSRQGRIIGHPDPKVGIADTMRSLSEKNGNPEINQIFERVSSDRQGSLSYLSNQIHQRVHENYRPVHEAGWGVVVGYYESEFLRQVATYRWIAGGSLAAILVLLVLIVTVAVGAALRPIGRLTDVSLEISKGNLDLQIDAPKHESEIGHLTRAFILMRDTLIKNRELEKAVLERSGQLAAANEKLTAENLERRWANQSLEHQLRYDRMIISSISDLVIVCTKVLNISRINPAVVRATGWQASDLVNSPLSRIIRLEGPDAEGSSLFDPLLQALRDGRDLVGRRAVIVDKAGALTQAELALYPIRDQDKVVGGVAVLRLTTKGNSHG